MIITDTIIIIIVLFFLRKMNYYYRYYHQDLIIARIGALYRDSNRFRKHLQIEQISSTSTEAYNMLLTSTCSAFPDVFED